MCPEMLRQNIKHNPPDMKKAHMQVFYFPFANKHFFLLMKNLVVKILNCIKTIITTTNEKKKVLYEEIVSKCFIIQDKKKKYIYISYMFSFKFIKLENFFFSLQLLLTLVTH